MLCHLLLDNPVLQNSDSYALLALMYFQASRFEARLDKQENIILLEEQDRTLWDQEMINRGLFYFSKAFSEEYFSQYHLEAGIALEHSIAESFNDTNWENILMLYDKIITENNSPVILLNRAIVVWKLSGPLKALEEITYIEDIKTLNSYYLYHATLGSLNLELKNNHVAKEHFLKAISLTSSNSEKKLLYRKIGSLN
jgi:predicted RNA polymerase sigma factor